MMFCYVSVTIVNDALQKDGDTKDLPPLHFDSLFVILELWLQYCWLHAGVETRGC